MTELIGREEEKEILNKLLLSEKSELLAIYGRRRIGKTFLIKEFFQDQGIFFELTGVLGGRSSEQLWNFSETVNKTFKAKEPTSPPKTWKKAFSILVDIISSIPKEQRIILFFDELPWLATPRSDLIRSLEYAWNRYLSRRKNILMILCGSAASWMIKKIVQNRGGLHGRLTQKIHLQPFSLYETEKYLAKSNIHLDRKQLVEIYMLTGGVAKYLDHIEQGLSSSQVIQTLCFSKHGFLKDEFYPLISSLFGTSERYLAIIKILAKSHKGLQQSEIVKLLSKKISGHISDTLSDLEASGFVQFIPFYGRKKRDGLYRLVDEYSLFYLTWIDNHEKLVQFHRSPKFLSWTGYVFENICIKHSKQIIEALKLPVIAKSIAYWEQRQHEYAGAQIDLIIDRTDRYPFS
ncbi:MAG: AAA family ATPase [Chlamydiia bacterium]|nr:AAA family ATPase [Chlamydiia bacterium]